MSIKINNSIVISDTKNIISSSDFDVANQVQISGIFSGDGSLLTGISGEISPGIIYRLPYTFEDPVGSINITDPVIVDINTTLNFPVEFGAFSFYNDYPTLVQSIGFQIFYNQTSNVFLNGGTRNSSVYSPDFSGTYYASSEIILDRIFTDTNSNQGIFKIRLATGIDLSQNSVNFSTIETVSPTPQTNGFFGVCEDKYVSNNPLSTLHSFIGYQPVFLVSDQEVDGGITSHVNVYYFDTNLFQFSLVQRIQPKTSDEIFTGSQYASENWLFLTYFNTLTSSYGVDIYSINTGTYSYSLHQTISTFPAGFSFSSVGGIVIDIDKSEVNPSFIIRSITDNGVEDNHLVYKHSGGTWSYVNSFKETYDSNAFAMQNGHYNQGYYVKAYRATGSAFEDLVLNCWDLTGSTFSISDTVTIQNTYEFDDIGGDLFSFRLNKFYLKYYKENFQTVEYMSGNVNAGLLDLQKIKSFLPTDSHPQGFAFSPFVVENKILFLANNGGSSSRYLTEENLDIAQLESTKFSGYKTYIKN